MNAWLMAILSHLAEVGLFFGAALLLLLGLLGLR